MQRAPCAARKHRLANDMQSIFDNGPQAPCPKPFNMAAHVLSQSHICPDKIALQILHSDHCEDWTYRDLEAAVLESDLKLSECFHVLARWRVTRRMWAINSQASALAIDFSQSLARRRQRPSHAKVRSTTHLRGKTLKPSAISERLII